MSGEDFQSRYATVMDSMLRGAVAETTRLFQTMVDELKKEINAIKQENEELRSKCMDLEETPTTTTSTSTSTTTEPSGGEDPPPCGGGGTSGEPPGPSEAGGPVDRRDTAIQCDLVRVGSCQHYNPLKLKDVKQAVEVKKQPKTHGDGQPLSEDDNPTAVYHLRLLREKEGQRKPFVKRITIELPKHQSSSNRELAAFQQDQHQNVAVSDSPHLFCERGTQSQASQLVIIPLPLKAKMEQQSHVIQQIPVTTAASETAAETSTLDQDGSFIVPQKPRGRRKKNLSEVSPQPVLLPSRRSGRTPKKVKPWNSPERPVDNKAPSRSTCVTVDQETDKSPSARADEITPVKSSRRGRKPKEPRPSAIKRKVESICEYLTTDEPTAEEEACIPLADVEEIEECSLLIPASSPGREHTSIKPSPSKSKQLPVKPDEVTPSSLNENPSVTETVETPSTESAKVRSSAPPRERHISYPTLQEAMLLVEANAHFVHEATMGNKLGMQTTSALPETQHFPLPFTSPNQDANVPPKTTAPTVTLPTVASVRSTLKQPIPPPIITCAKLPIATPKTIIVVPRPISSFCPQTISTLSPTDMSTVIATVVSSLKNSLPQATAGETISPPSVAAVETISPPSVAAVETISPPSVAAVETISPPSVAAVETISPPSVAAVETISPPSVAAVETISPPTVAAVETISPPSVAAVPVKTAVATSSQLLSIAPPQTAATSRATTNSSMQFIDPRFPRVVVVPLQLSVLKLRQHNSAGYTESATASTQKSTVNKAATTTKTDTSTVNSATATKTVRSAVNSAATSQTDTKTANSATSTKTDSSSVNAATTTKKDPSTVSSAATKVSVVNSAAASTKADTFAVNSAATSTENDTPAVNSATTKAVASAVNSATTKTDVSTVSLATTKTVTSPVNSAATKTDMSTVNSATITKTVTSARKFTKTVMSAVGSATSATKTDTSAVNSATLATKTDMSTVNSATTTKTVTSAVNSAATKTNMSTVNSATTTKTVISAVNSAATKTDVSTVNSATTKTVISAVNSAATKTDVSAVNSAATPTKVKPLNSPERPVDNKAPSRSTCVTVDQETDKSPSARADEIAPVKSSRRGRKPKEPRPSAIKRKVESISEYLTTDEPTAEEEACIPLATKTDKSEVNSAATSTKTAVNSASVKTDTSKVNSATTLTKKDTSTVNSATTLTKMDTSTVNSATTLTKMDLPKVNSTTTLTKKDMSTVNSATTLTKKDTSTVNSAATKASAVNSAAVSTKTNASRVNSAATNSAAASTKTDRSAVNSAATSTETVMSAVNSATTKTDTPTVNSATTLTNKNTSTVNSAATKAPAVNLAAASTKTDTSAVNSAATSTETQTNTAGCKMTIASTKACSSLKNSTSSTHVQTLVSPSVSPVVQRNRYPVVRLTRLSLTALQKEMSLVLKTSPLITAGAGASAPPKVPNIVQEIPGAAAGKSSQVSPASQQDVDTISLTSAQPTEAQSRVDFVPPMETAAVHEKPTEEAIKSAQPTSDSLDDYDDDDSFEPCSGWEDSPDSPCIQTCVLPEVTTSVVSDKSSAIKSIKQPVASTEENDLVSKTLPPSTKTSSSKNNTSDPHLQMTKTQFLSQMAMLPVEQACSNDDMDTPAVKDKNPLVKRLRSHRHQLKSHQSHQPSHTEPNSAILPEPEPTPVPAKKARLVGEDETPTKTSAEPSPSTCPTVTSCESILVSPERCESSKEVLTPQKATVTPSSFSPTRSSLSKIVAGLKKITSDPAHFRPKTLGSTKDGCEKSLNETSPAIAKRQRLIEDTVSAKKCRTTVNIASEEGLPKAADTPKLSKMKKAKTLDQSASEERLPKAADTPELSKVKTASEEMFPTTADTPKLSKMKTASEERLPKVADTPKLSKMKTASEERLPKAADTPKLSKIKTASEERLPKVADTPKLSKIKTASEERLPNVADTPKLSKIKTASEERLPKVADTPKLSKIKTASEERLPKAADTPKLSKMKKAKTLDQTASEQRLPQKADTPKLPKMKKAKTLDQTASEPRLTKANLSFFVRKEAKVVLTKSRMEASGSPVTKNRSSSIDPAKTEPQVWTPTTPKLYRSTGLSLTTPLSPSPPRNLFSPSPPPFHLSPSPPPFHLSPSPPPFHLSPTPPPIKFSLSTSPIMPNFLSSTFSGPSSPFQFKEFKFPRPSSSVRSSISGKAIKKEPVFRAPPIISPLQPLSFLGRRLLKNQCGQCGRMFPSSAALESHVGLHKDLPPFTCVHCGKVFHDNRALNRHHKQHRDGKVHKCEQCGKGFVYKFTLKKHIEMVHGRIKPFICQICHKGFSTKEEVNSHVRVHTGETPYHCHLCVKQFKRKMDLNKHLRWHNGEKRYWCPYCEKGFLDSNNLKYHKYTHTGEKPRACPRCPKKFTQTGHLKKHLRTVHKHEENAQ